MDVVKSVTLKRKPKEKERADPGLGLLKVPNRREQVLAANRGPANRLARVLGRATDLKTAARVQRRRKVSSPSVMAAARLKVPKAPKGPKAKVVPTRRAEVARLRLIQAKFFAKGGRAEGKDDSD